MEHVERHSSIFCCCVAQRQTLPFFTCSAPVRSPIFSYAHVSIDDIFFRTDKEASLFNEITRTLKHTFSRSHRTNSTHCSYKQWCEWKKQEQILSFTIFIIRISLLLLSWFFLRRSFFYIFFMYGGGTHNQRIAIIFTSKIKVMFSSMLILTIV